MIKMPRSDLTQFKGLPNRDDLTMFGFNKCGGGSSQPTIFDYVPSFEPLTQGSVSFQISKTEVNSIWSGSPSAIGAFVFSGDKIDFTDVNEVKVTVFISHIVSSEVFTHLLVCDSKTMFDPRQSGATLAETHTNTEGEEITLTLDVSSITGEHYLALAPTGATVDFYNLSFN